MNTTDSQSTHQPHTLLILKRFTEVQRTRVSIVKEFESALEGCLASSSSDEEPNLSNQSQDLGNGVVSACRHEYKGPDADPEEYIQQVISLSTSGLLELKDETNLLVRMLNVDLNRSDLANLLSRIDELESKKMNECLHRDMIRRKSVVEGRDYNEQISGHRDRILALSLSITEIMEEVQAEVAELS